MRKRSALQITGVAPFAGVPGGELAIRCRGFIPDLDSRVLLGDVEASLVSASDDKVVVRLPESPKSLGLALKVRKTVSEVFPFSLATRLSGDLHPVTNPVVAPDGSVITTISGSRGQQVSQPLVRITRRGEKIPYPCEIMNPTGLAFSPDGQLYISSRNDGTILRYTDCEHLDVVAEDLGVPCGIVFDSKGLLYVGDRTGRILRIDASGHKEEFAQIEPSVSAYHLAMDAQDQLYITGPTLALRDRLYRLSGNGAVEKLIEGLARPQGMGFLAGGDLLIATGYEGKKGIFRYSPKDGSFSHYITSLILVGLAVAGESIYLASSDSIWQLVVGSRQ
jgi:sugar lactone lactonase YvrE